RSEKLQTEPPMPRKARWEWCRCQEHTLPPKAAVPGKFQTRTTKGPWCHSKRATAALIATVAHVTRPQKPRPHSRQVLYCRAVAIAWNLDDRLVPTRVMAPMITTEIRPAISPYPMAVAPDLSRRNRLRK